MLFSGHKFYIPHTIFLYVFLVSARQIPSKNNVAIKLLSHTKKNRKKRIYFQSEYKVHAKSFYFLKQWWFHEAQNLFHVTKYSLYESLYDLNFIKSKKIHKSVSFQIQLIIKFNKTKIPQNNFLSSKSTKQNLCSTASICVLNDNEIKTVTYSKNEMSIL